MGGVSSLFGLSRLHLDKDAELHCEHNMWHESNYDSSFKRKTFNKNENIKALRNAKQHDISAQQQMIDFTFFVNNLQGNEPRQHRSPQCNATP